MKKTLIAAFAFVTAVAGAADYPYRAVEITNVVVTGGFWLPRVETNRLVTVPAAFKKCEETGRIANFENAAAGKWGVHKGIRFNDSDVYKIIEGASYTLATHPDPKLDKYIDDIIAKIAGAQEPDGYLYTARTLGKFDPRNIGTTRWSAIFESHELYNMGHLFEAAAAHYAATGKTNLLSVACRAADLVDRAFGPEPTQIKDAPGHEEIELGLCRLYRATDNVRYLKLAKFFIDQRGAPNCTKRSGVRFVQRQDHAAKSDATLPGAYGQYHKLVVDQKEAVGHAVRAGYLYCGLTDVAALTAGDPRYMVANDALWENVVGRKMHITGGIGARRKGEAFGVDYELPNETAYLETCAAIANALWNERLFLMHGDAKYVDVLERVVYNGFLSGISLDGLGFFYPNPLASKGGYGRSAWFGCSCCPGNVVRFIPQIASFAYAMRGDAAYVNLFIDSTAKLALAGGEIALKQTTDYPWKGASRVVVTPAKAGQRFALNVRIPGWCVGRPVPSDLYTQVVPGTAGDFSVKVNGQAVAGAPQKGYCVIDRAWKAGDVVEIEMAMPVRRIRAHAKVEADRGRLAVERGPIVYCAEGADNGGKAFDAKLPANAAFTDSTVNVNGAVFPSLRSGALTLIPYFAWCHRDKGEMQTWFAE